MYVCMYGCMYVCMYLIYWTSIRRIEHIAKHEDEDTMMSSAPDYMHLLCIFLLWAFFLSVHLCIVWMWVRKMHKHMHTTTQQEGWHNSNWIFFLSRFNARIYQFIFNDAHLFVKHRCRGCGRCSSSMFPTSQVFFCHYAFV